MSGSVKASKQASFTLGHCKVSPADNSVVFDAESKADVVCLSLQPKFIEVLSYLARHYPNVVTRDELIEEIWDGNGYVGTKALTNAIWHLRQQLKPLNSEQPIIETVRKAGYRLLIAPQFNAEDLVDEPDLLRRAEKQINLLQRKLTKFALASGTVLVAVSALLVWHLYHDEVHLIPTVKQQLTKAADAELYPNVSPDGRWLVYGSRGNGKRSSLYLKDLNSPTEMPKRLTSAKSSELRAVWSPDGQMLYYPSQELKDCQIMQLTLDSNEARPLTPCNSYTAALDVSPNGERLVFIWQSNSDATSGLYSFALKETDSLPVRLSCINHCSHRDRDVAFSPDGRYMAISRRFGNISEDIFLLDLTTGQERRLTTGLEDIRGLSWHQDGHRLVFSTENSGVRNGYLIDVEHEGVQALDVEGMSYPRFIPHSNELVYANYIRDYRVTSLALEQSIPTTSFPLLRVEYSYRNPTYSAIAQRIAYVSNETGFNEIWSADSTGNNRRQHTNLKRRVAYPSWSRDGSKIAFLAPDDQNEGNKIHVLDLQTGNIAILATPYLDHNRPSWGWDNETVIASTDDGITEFYLDNRLPHVLSHIDMRLGQMISSQQLLFTRADKDGLWSIDLSQPDKVHALISEKKFDEGYNWIATDKGIYFRDNQQGFQLINFWRFNTELVTPIIKLPPGTMPRAGSMGYMPELHSLLLTQSQNYKRDVIRLQHKLLQ